MIELIRCEFVRVQERALPPRDAQKYDTGGNWQIFYNESFAPKNQGKRAAKTGQIRAVRIILRKFAG
jgi:hypothetical protein